MEAQWGGQHLPKHMESKWGILGTTPPPKQVTRFNCVNVSVFDSFMFCESVQWYVSQNTCLNEVDMQNSRLVVVTLLVDVEKTQRIAA
jgi:hypothetical protein